MVDLQEYLKVVRSVIKAFQTPVETGG